MLGGVCGGLAARLPVSSWAVRVLWGILTVATLGAFAALYVALWLLVPQPAPTQPDDAGVLWLMLFVLLTALVTALWLARLNGLTRLESGNLYYPLLALLLSLVFLTRQLKRAT